MSQPMPDRPRGARLTMLNSMAGRDLPAALDRHVEWGLEVLDLKDCLFGKAVMDLTDEDAGRAANMVERRGLSVWCMSTHLFCDDVERGELHFAAQHAGRVERAVELARILRPALVRLLAAGGERRCMYDDCVEYLAAEHPWLIPMYAQAIDRLHAAGFQATIENEVGPCILRTPADVTALFAELGRREKVCFTYDVQNLWQMGTFPTMHVYEQLRGLIGYLHLKGGQCDDGDSERTLRWRSSLAEASWPVAEITRRAVADGVCPVVCLNPSHGRPRQEGKWEDFTKDDLNFIRESVPEIDE